MEKLINEFFDSEKFLIRQRITKQKITNKETIHIEIYNPLKLKARKNELGLLPYELCLAMEVSAQYISVEYLNQCGIQNAGKFFLEKVKEFAIKNGFKKIYLEDVSEFYIYFTIGGVLDSEMSISLQRFKLLKEGVSWYGKNGFTNEYYESNKGAIIEFINTPIRDIIKKLYASLRYEHIQINKKIEFLQTFLGNVDFFDKNKFVKSDEESHIRLKNYIDSLISFIGKEYDYSIVTISQIMTDFEIYLKINCKDNKCEISENDIRDEVRKISTCVNYFFSIMLHTLNLLDYEFNFLELN